MPEAGIPLPSATRKSLRSTLLDLLCAAVLYTGLLWLGLRIRRFFGGGRTRVLCYHRVAEDAWPDTLTRHRFRAHLVHLRRNYKLIDLGTIVQCLSADRPLPRDAVALTFDDGYRDLLDILDDLQRHGVPAAFFVLTGHLPGSGVSFIDLIRGTSLEASQKSLASLPSEAREAELQSTSLAGGAPLLMSAAELRTALESGVEIGSHTRSHSQLTTLPHVELNAEVEGSREDLRVALGAPPRFFAYPWGKHNELARAAVRSAGFAAAFTTEDRAVDDDTDLLVIPRVHVPGNATLARLAGEASGLVEFLRRVA